MIRAFALFLALLLVVPSDSFGRMAKPDYCFGDGWLSEACLQDILSNGFVGKVEFVSAKLVKKTPEMPESREFTFKVIKQYSGAPVSQVVVSPNVVSCADPVNCGNAAGDTMIISVTDKSAAREGNYSGDYTSYARSDELEKALDVFVEKKAAE